MTIKELQEEIIEDFDLFDDWMERYEFIIENGKSLPQIAEVNKSDDNIIKGCQSKVWLFAEMENDVIKYYADSDAIITKGIKIGDGATIASGSVVNNDVAAKVLVIGDPARIMKKNYNNSKLLGELNIEEE